MLTAGIPGSPHSVDFSSVCLSTTTHTFDNVPYLQNQLRNGIGKSLFFSKMNTAKFLILFSITLGLASASPASMLASVPRSPFAPVARSDDDHLCSAPTDTVFEYGNQTNQDGIVADCDKLSQFIKGFADEHGNFTEMCEPGLGFQRFSSEGNCTMWFECEKTTEGLEVT